MNVTEELSYVLDNVGNTVIDHSRERFNRKDYTISLNEYPDEIKDVFNPLQKWCDENPDDRDEAIALVAENFVKQIQADVKNPAKHRGLNARALVQDDYLLIVVAYLNPAIEKLNLDIGHDLCVAIHEEWIKVWPKQNYQITGEEQINSGFVRRILGINIEGLFKKKK